MQNIEEILEQCTQQVVKHDCSGTSSYVNDKYLDNSQMKTTLDAICNRMHVAEGNIKKLQDKVTRLINKQGESVDTELQRDLVQILEKKTMKKLGKHLMRAFCKAFVG